MGHLGKEVQDSKLPEHGLELRDTCSRWALPRCPWDSWPKGRDIARGDQSEVFFLGLRKYWYTVLVFKTAPVRKLGVSEELALY